MRAANLRDQSGFTFIEMIISMTIIGIAVSGTLQTIRLVNSRSTDPMIASQAMAVARAYLEEIMLRDWSDTDDPAFPQAVGAGNPTWADPAEVLAYPASRQFFDNVFDFNGIVDSPPVDQFGADLSVPFPNLVAYQVSVNITQIAGWGPGGLTLPDSTLRIAVNVTHPRPQTNLTLVGYRTRY